MSNLGKVNSLVGRVTMPSYLKGYEKEYELNPRETNKEWLRKAKYGLFIHYGLFSLYNTIEWVQYHEKIYVKDYEKRMDEFRAENFDADKIVSMAKDCGMKYITFTTRHHDSFCLFETKETEFQSLNSPAKRDLVREMVDACEKQGVALFLYYSHGRDWRHPHGPNNDEWGGMARPEYNPPEPTYAYAEEHDLNIYLEYMKKQCKELVKQYPTIAGIWFDGVAVPLHGETEKFKCQELYDHIRSNHPHALISYKQGVTGTEDYFAPEHSLPERGADKKKAGKIFSKKRPLVEVCTTILENPRSWGCCKDSRVRTVEDLLGDWNKAELQNANFLINMGPLPDGSINPEEEALFHELLKHKNS